jgi:creatinine amidohydrolase
MAAEPPRVDIGQVIRNATLFNPQNKLVSPAATWKKSSIFWTISGGGSTVSAINQHPIRNDHTMNWQDLTSDQFPAAVKAAQGVCLVPLGCLERHAHHLPVGTDKFIAHELCRRAAELEPALVFPDYFFTQILEGAHYPGCIAISPDLILALLENVCAEIARNGLDKVVLVNAHGGNSNLLSFFAQAQLASRRDYVVYVVDHPPLLKEDEALAGQWQTTVDGHAGEIETSEILAIAPQLVHMEAVPAEPEGMPLERLKALQEASVFTGIWWYGDHPTHYRGDARSASAEKGNRWLDGEARAIAAAVRAIKQDQESRRLQDEFFDAAER